MLAAAPEYDTATLPIESNLRGAGKREQRLVTLSLAELENSSPRTSLTWMVEFRLDLTDFKTAFQSAP